MTAKKKVLMPYKMNLEGSIEWLDVKNKRFTEPFWNETIAYCRANYRNFGEEKIITNLADVIEKSQDLDFVAPSSIIFHVSRCGSTLISQLLSLSEKNIVLAEPSIIDEIFCYSFENPDFSEEKKMSAARAILQFWGQKRSGHEQHLFLKTDCWHLYFYETIRKMYPDVPILLMYRNPLEILHSQRKRRGRQAVQGVNNPKTLELSMEEIQFLSLDEYMGLVLHKLFLKMKFIAENDKNCLLVNYSQGIMPIMHLFSTFTKIPFSDEEISQMKERSNFHAKYPEQKFEEKIPKENVPDYLKEAMNLYVEMEQLRKKI